HFITSYQAWDEDRLNAEERRRVQQHLGECVECRRYFETMSVLLEKTDSSLLPRIEPDPFLPTRIRAMDKATRTPIPRCFIAWARISLVSVMIMIALSAGIYLGRGLATATRSNGETEIASAYYEAFSQSGFAAVWGDVVDGDEEEQQ
ncbi:MAG: zf-HC2 domain-containing protein, partial [Candidatus Latescibacterota bacterium]